MEINGKVYCLFEQSGTFKTEFIKLGIKAEDYDLQNNFGMTDYQIDLFEEIDSAYRGERSLFDKITYEDLIIAFFPCVYFCENNQLYFTGKHQNVRNMSCMDRTNVMIKRSKERERLWELLLMLFAVCDTRGLRLIVENPYSVEHFLVNNFPYMPSIIDKDRRLRGDYYKKPTQYFFVNCTPTEGCTLLSSPVRKKITSGSPGIRQWICSEERSLISPNYARNFICDFIIGKVQDGSQLSLFVEDGNIE